MHEKGIHQCQSLFEEKKESVFCFQITYLNKKLQFFYFKYTGYSFSVLVVFFMIWVLSF